MSPQPCHTARVFTENYESGRGRNTRREGWGWRRSGEATALRGLSLIDLWWICLVSTLFKHEHVLCLFLPDGGLHADISPPDDHVTYGMLCGDLTSAHIRYILSLWCLWPFLLLISHNPSIRANTCLFHRTRNSSFREAQWGLALLGYIYLHKWISSGPSSSQ